VIHAGGLLRKQHCSVPPAAALLDPCRKGGWVQVTQRMRHKWGLLLLLLGLLVLLLTPLNQLL
jgi:hypothetical protein